MCGQDNDALQLTFHSRPRYVAHTRAEAAANSRDPYGEVLGGSGAEGRADGTQFLGSGPTLPAGAQEAIQINPPNLNDYSSEEESDDEDAAAKPLTHEELKAKTMKVIHRRGNASTGSGTSAQGSRRR